MKPDALRLSVAQKKFQLIFFVTIFFMQLKMNRLRKISNKKNECLYNTHS